jgi:hypothetical protein
MRSDASPVRLSSGSMRLGASPVRLSSGSMRLGASPVRNENIENGEGEVVNELNAAHMNERQVLNIVRREALTADDLDCLTKFSGQESWLNNDVIMCYLINELPKIEENVMIVEINLWREGSGIPEDYRTIFYPEFKQNWSKLCIPIFVNENHWIHGIVDVDGKCDFYDSMGGALSEDQKKFIREIMGCLNVNNVEFVIVDKNTYYQQKNNHSCGPALCMIAERVMKGEDLKFNQPAVNNWRKRALRILRDEILVNVDQGDDDEVQEIEIELNDSNGNSKGKKRKPNLSYRHGEAKKRKQGSERVEKHRDSLSEEKRDANRQDDRDRKRDKRADEDVKAMEFARENENRTARRAADKLKNKDLFSARTPIEDEKDVPYCDIGDLILECKYCKARFFKGEHVAGKPKNTFDKCCKSGKVKLDNAFDDYPSELYDLLAKDHDFGKDKKKKNDDKTLTELFHENPRNYNSAFAFASMKAQSWDKSTMPHAYRIQGQIYHTVNLAAHPDLNEKPCYAQLFYLDTEEAIKERMEHPANKKCDERVMREIEQALYGINPYMDSLRMMCEVEKEVNEEAERNGEDPPEVRLLFDVNNVDKRRFNVPKTNEIAAVFVLNDNNELPEAEGLIIHQRDKKLQKLTKFEKRAESMLYPIYFPTGKGGCGIGIKNTEGKKVTFNQYYRYMTAIRMPNVLEMNKKRFGYASENLYSKTFKQSEKIPINAHEWNKTYSDNFELLDFSPIRLGGKLLQQYLVDAYVKIEQDRLDYIRYNQKELKSENYQTLHDYVNTTADEQGKNVGKTIILPSSFKGSPRHCQQGYQDSMALVRRFGKPCLFVTFTCNPTWPEITRNLQPGNSPTDEPDLVDRVFNLKLKEMLKDIKEREIFGKVIGYTYVVEFQKRGLPHAHILLILDSDSKTRTPEDIDDVVCAEIPDEDKNPRLHAIVTKHMIHGPCGELNKNCVCMEEAEDGKKYCSKKFPKEFRKETEVGKDSYAQYRRRDNGVTHEMPNGTLIDNRWVVPYNKYLSLKYAAHINVEVCASIKSVKYLYKYVYKGHDCARMVISVNGNDEVVYDEVKRYVDYRYVTPHEAYWRIAEFTLDEKSHSITRLNLHLPDQEIVYYKPGENVKNKLGKAERKFTTLTAWFELNKVDPEAKKLFYHEIPEHYTFKQNSDKSNMIWGVKGGERGIITKPCIGRMFTAHPKQGELFYLRMLLLHVKGAESWEDLLTFDGTVHDKFEDVARAMGLIENDKEWSKYFEEACSYASPANLRELFVAVLTHGENLDAKELWNRFQENMYEDFVHKGNNVVRAQSLAKADIERQLQINGTSLTKFGIDLPDQQFDNEEFWDLNEEQRIGNEMRDKMNRRQRQVTNYVFEKIAEFKEGKLENGCICIDGPGGSGKTYTYETLCRLFRAEGIRYKCSSWMGIAADLMLDGRTMHKNFALPFNIDKDSNSNAKMNNKVGRELMETDVFIIDEISMVPKHALEIIDRKLRELLKCDLPFGGRLMIIGGDFRQILPIQKRAGKDALIGLSVRHSYLWKNFKVFRLKKNQRVLNVVQGDDSVMEAREDFAGWLLKFGDGETPMDEDEYVEIPNYVIAKKDLIEETFGEFIRKNDLTGMSNRVILTTTNDRVNEINDRVLGMLKDNDMKTYYSVDSIDKNEPTNCIEYPPEFLHSLRDSGLPPHELKLKKDCPVILKRNLNLAKGLSNGTRLRVKLMHKNILECEFMFGPRAGERVLIPRITLTSAEGHFPFELSRKQFPVQLCFAMTINKSQGQTIDFVGLDLIEPVFAHGMAYVAVSRVRSWDCIKIAVKPEKGNKIKNIVWKEVLLEKNDDTSSDVEMEEEETVEVSE